MLPHGSVLGIIIYLPLFSTMDLQAVDRAIVGPHHSSAGEVPTSFGKKLAIHPG